MRVKTINEKCKINHKKCKTKINTKITYNKLNVKQVKNKIYVMMVHLYLHVICHMPEFHIKNYLYFKFAVSMKVRHEEMKKNCFIGTFISTRIGSFPFDSFWSFVDF